MKVSVKLKDNDPIMFETYEDAMDYYEEVKKAKPELVSQLDFIESMGESTPKFDKFD